MKISHELPISLLKYGEIWNDYNYILPCFMDKYEEYRKYYLEQSKTNKFTILDNSLFEGYFHTTQELLDKIQLIQPNIFIVPDAWNDKDKTLVNAKSWIINYKYKLPEKTNLMAVLQGKTYGELLECYQTLVDLGFKYIAFNHSSEAYLNTCPNKDKLVSQVEGRKFVIDNLLKDKILDTNIYHHLLGASLASEFRFYKTGYEFIKSVDTSSPIINGALGIRYQKYGVPTKPIEKLEHFMEMDLSDKVEDIQHNVSTFRKICQDS